MKSVISGMGGALLGVVFAYLASSVALAYFGVEISLNVPYEAHTLNVGRNYGEQVTAPINRLEPKVSDAYYQWSGTVVMSDVKDLNIIQGGN